MRKVLLVLFFLWVLCFAHPLWSSPIYVYKEKDGAIRFTNKKPPPGVKAKVFTAKGRTFSYFGSRKEGRLFLNEYEWIIKQAAKQHSVTESLIRAVIHAESAFNPKAVSHKGAQGLMQLMPVNVRKYKVRDPFNPMDNIFGGVKLLAMLIKKYNGNLRHALAAYNAGEEAVAKYNGIPPYKETQGYVKKVLRLKRRYASVANG